MLKLHDLKPARGSKKNKKRLARGIAGKGGKTAGRGTKGQGARDTIPPGFEGGQLPLMQRIPKLKGFKNPFKIEYQVVNLSDLNRIEVESINPELLAKLGLVKKDSLVKILGNGQLDKKVAVCAHSFSKSAKSKIELKGGSCETLPLPYKSGRPPANGSALANR